MYREGVVWCGLCGFLIIKPQTALHLAVWCGAVYYYLRRSAVKLFCRRFWCGSCGLANTPNCCNTLQKGRSIATVQLNAAIYLIYRGGLKKCHDM